MISVLPKQPHFQVLGLDQAYLAMQEKVQQAQVVSQHLDKHPPLDQQLQVDLEQLVSFFMDSDFCLVCTVDVICNILNTRKSVSSDIQTLRSGLKNEAQWRIEKRGTAEFF